MTTPPAGAGLRSPIGYSAEPRTHGNAEDTFPRMLAALAERFGDERIALQEKRYGIWQPVTWREYYEWVRRVASGLAALGVRAGEVVAVIGDNRPEWLVTELAAQALGACVVGVYPTSVGEEVAHILRQGRVRVVVAEDQEQVDKTIELWDSLPTVEHLVYYDPLGIEGYDQPYLLRYPDLDELGRQREREHSGWLDEQLAACRSSDIAVICTTSGTTGMPKLAMLSHANLVTMGRSLMEADPLGLDDRHLSVLPLAWIGEQMITLACGLQAGFTISFAEEAATAKADLREIGPSVMFGPPRIWEDMASSVQVRVADAGWLKRGSFSWAFSVGERAAELRMRGERAGITRRVGGVAADWLALRPVREQLGLSRIKRCYTGGAPLGPDVFRFFHAIGVNLKQIYGQTEIAGIAVAHRDGDVRANTVGVPISGTELRISPSGEILLRSGAVFEGYYGDEDATAFAVDNGGWLLTGDAGYVDDAGHLVVIDRAKDVLRLVDGTSFSPAFLESKLKFSPYIEEAVVFGGESSLVTVLLVIDPHNVGTWAEHAHLSYTTYTDLAQKPETYGLVAGEVERANRELPEGMRIARFAVLHKQLDPDDGEITRTRKVRRRVITQRYREVIDALNGEADEVSIRTTVRYQDGSEADRDVTIRVQSMRDWAPATRRTGRRLLRSRR